MDSAPPPSAWAPARLGLADGPRIGNQARLGSARIHNRERTHQRATSDAWTAMKSVERAGVIDVLWLERMQAELHRRIEVVWCTESVKAAKRGRGRRGRRFGHLSGRTEIDVIYT
ncbi:unnamed protein product [Peniophora sp. CBMAI 1063]|nr:unnamed protein product [Peniophora sp. CBMAI 1063]